MANSRWLAWPWASSTAPDASAAIPSANGPGWINPRLSNCWGNGRATRRQSYSIPLELISAAPATSVIVCSPR